VNKVSRGSGQLRHYDGIPSFLNGSTVSQTSLLSQSSNETPIIQRSTQVHIDRAPQQIDIPLSKAPEIFFDQQLWQIFVSYFESPEMAVERISGPPSLTGRHREQDGWLPQSYNERWQYIQEASDVARALLLGLQSRFLKGEVIATGMPMHYTCRDRVPIPAEEWLRLWPDFTDDMAMSGGRSALRYDDIRLSAVENQELHTAYLTKNCVTFLQQRNNAGESRRKILVQEATEHFGAPLPARVFSAAYKTVFNKQRGRPRTKK
jgi:hypothetical protein